MLEQKDIVRLLELTRTVCMYYVVFSDRILYGYDDELFNWYDWIFGLVEQIKVSRSSDSLRCDSFGDHRKYVTIFEFLHEFSSRFLRGYLYSSHKRECSAANLNHMSLEKEGPCSNFEYISRLPYKFL